METLKRLALSAFMGGLISLAFCMPATLQSGILDRMDPIARYFCPDTGKLAPRYWHGRSVKENPDHWEACLDQEGNRIISASTHRSIVFTVAGFWFILTVPLMFTLLGPMFPRRRIAKRLTIKPQ